MACLTRHHPNRAYIRERNHLKKLADFEDQTPAQEVPTSEATVIDTQGNVRAAGGESDVDLRLSYTINLVLPKTDDPAVFNAIFRSLRENLLRK